MDKNIGRLMGFLDRKGLTNDTLVIYTSDQGVFMGEHGLYDKRLGLEEALRMPFIARYPREIPRQSVGQHIVQNVDFAATLLDYAGSADLPNSQGQGSFRALMRGQENPNWNNVSFYEFSGNACPDHYGVRTHRFKLMSFPTVGKNGCAHLLFDLEKDPLELQNVATDELYTEALLVMRTLLADTMKRIFSPEEILSNPMFQCS